MTPRRAAELAPEARRERGHGAPVPGSAQPDPLPVPPSGSGSGTSSSSPLTVQGAARSPSPGPGDAPCGTPGPGAGQAARVFTIALPAGLKLLSLNDRLHWRVRHGYAQGLKDAACTMARHAKVPHLERAWIAVEYQPPDRRHRDADNPVASAKAAIDGIVLAGVLKDDECPRYVAGVWCTIGEIYPKGRLVLHLTELAGDADAA